MKKVLLILIMFAIIVMIIGGGVLLLQSSRNGSLFISGDDNKSTEENKLLSNSEEIIEKTRKDNLITSIDLRDSIILDCDWTDTPIHWEYPDTVNVPLYAATSHLNELSLSEQSDNTFKNEENAVNAFIKEFPEVNTMVSFAYTPEIYSPDANASEKVPLYFKKHDISILSSFLGIWRNADEGYIAGLYDTENGISDYDFDPNNSWTSTIIDEHRATELLMGNSMKFINHEFDCEREDLIEKTIDEIAIVYHFRSDTLVPVFEIQGSFKFPTQTVKWTAFMNLFDLNMLDYSIYVNMEDNVRSIPKPYIHDISLSKGEYTVKGSIPGSIIENGQSVSLEKTDVDIKVTQETGSYVYGERKSALLQEIKDSLVLENDGTFSFSFSANNFWKVEELQYENAEGNELEEPTHSSLKEIDRFSYDNNFQILVCSFSPSAQYCGEASNTMYLEGIE